MSIPVVLFVADDAVDQDVVVSVNRLLVVSYVAVGQNVMVSYVAPTDSCLLLMVLVLVLVTTQTERSTKKQRPSLESMERG